MIAASRVALLALLVLSGASLLRQVDAARAAEVLIAAAGDVACDPDKPADAGSCKDAETAALVMSRKPALVLALGDIQYVNGSLDKLRRGYDRSWGQFKHITRPTVGNHEYLSGTAKGYHDYFGGVAGGEKGYYAFDVNGWRLYSINSECNRIDCGKQRAWLKADLAANPRTCQLMFMHQPLYSSGGHESPYPRPFWIEGYRNRVELVLSGHEHRYERFAPMDPHGHVDSNGIRSFIVGTGGKSLFGRGIPAPGSQFRFNANYGVLVLRLRPSSYAWEFRSIAGALVDSGTGTCRR